MHPEKNIVSKILRNIVLILFVVVFISIIYNFRNRESATVSALMADATASKEFKGVFVRDETIVTYSGTGILSYGVSDGGRLGSGSVIAEVYPDDSQISNNREIQQLTKELDILNKIQNPGTLESAQPANLSASIEETYRNLVYCRDMRDYDTISSEKDDLLVQLSTYQIITDDSVDFTQRILDINNQLNQLKLASVSPSEIITSDRSAYFVSYCDGFEDKFKKENIDSITAEMIKNVQDVRADDSRVVGKLIDGYEWYVAGVIDNSRKEYEIGDRVTLSFETTADTIDAEITDIRGSGSSSVIILSCSEFNYELVQHRCMNVELIKGSYTGLKVPREAIRFCRIEEKITDEETGIDSVVTTNYKGVYIQEGEQVEFRKIDVIYEGNDYVLSAVHENDKSYLSLYDDIMIEGVKKHEQ
ncbi:MAG: HlyD family efflux transporter periplasmic adaptor subunit [Oscillospiraceae bacterium]|nr:HlyD family efflux transporter periplasmic adaptor subunit [Oscillospiraceae bacterium]